MPRIDETLDAIGAAKWFSTLDLASGYWQVQMDPQDVDKTAVATSSGLYRFKVMPFGLVNAPATFERLMERVLAGLQWETCMVYLDDVLHFANTFETHLEHLNEVLHRLIKAGLKVSPRKCHFFQRKVNFLGHVVSDKGVAVDAKKIAVIVNWPQPRNLTDVQSFVDLCS